jgi:hypothetical protein
MTDQSGPPLAGLSQDTAIGLRWVLRDIKAKRTKLSPVSPDDLQTLIGMGLVEMRDEAPFVTNEGERASIGVEMPHPHLPNRQAL